MSVADSLVSQGNLSVSTTRLLKAILPDSCLWTSLRDCEGLSYENTLKELKTLYPANGKGDEEEMDEDGEFYQCKRLGLTKAVPEAIRKMISCNTAIEALGSMIWCVPAF